MVIGLHNLSQCPCFSIFLYFRVIWNYADTKNCRIYNGPDILHWPGLHTLEHFCSLQCVPVIKFNFILAKKRSFQIKYSNTLLSLHETVPFKSEAKMVLVFFLFQIFAEIFSNLTPLRFHAHLYSCCPYLKWEKETPPYKLK